MYMYIYIFIYMYMYMYIYIYICMSMYINTGSSGTACFQEVRGPVLESSRTKDPRHSSQ